MEREVDVPQLDGLRFVAALIVFISHFSNATNIFGSSLGQGAGQIGVMLFFLLSAFLMGWLYLPNPFTVESAKQFAQRRAARVLPLYILAVLLFWAAFNSLGASSPTSLVRNENLAEHLLLVQGNGEFWTIPVEIHFYVLFLGLWWIYARSVEALILISAAVILVMAYLDAPTMLTQGSLLRHLHYFLAGILCAIFALRRVGRIKPVWADIVFILTLTAIPFLYPRIREFITGIKAEVWSAEFVMIVLALFLVSSLYSPIANRLLGNAPMRYLGNLSYAMYLVHMPVMTFIGFSPLIRGTPAAYFVISLCLTLLLSAALFHGFERPMRKWLRGRSEVREPTTMGRLQKSA